MIPFKDVAVIQYTGGTTGLPKGAMLTHFNIVANAHQIASWDVKASDKDVYLGALPIFHSYGFTMANAAFLLGAKIVLLPDPRDFDQYLKVIQKHKITTFPGVPTMYIALLNNPKIKGYDLSSIRTCISGAAPLPVEVKKKWEALTGGNSLKVTGLVRLPL